MIVEYVHTFPSGASMTITGWRRGNGLQVIDMRYDPAPNFKTTNLTDLTGKPPVYCHIEPRLVA